MEGSSKKLKFDTLDDGERVQFMDVDTDEPVSDLEAMDTDPELVIKVAPRQAEEALKVLMEHREHKRTATLLAKFEQTSNYLRQFVQRRQLWMQLFQKTFPEHYADAVTTYPLGDGTGRQGVTMNQRIKAMLDRYSVRPGREETYWKRYYELLTRGALPYGKDPEVLHEWEIDTEYYRTPIGIRIWKTVDAIFYFAVIYEDKQVDLYNLVVRAHSYHEDDDAIQPEPYQVDLHNFLVRAHSYPVPSAVASHVAYLGLLVHGLIDDSARNRGIFIWKTYHYEHMNDWIEFQFSKDLKKITIKYHNWYCSSISAQTIQFGTQKDWRGVKYGSEPDVFDTCTLYRHSDPAEDVVFITPAYRDADGLIMHGSGEYSRWAYRIGATVKLVEVTQDIIGEHVTPLFVHWTEDNDQYLFRWQNFYKTKEYFYNHDERRLYISELPENKTTLVSSPIWCEHCDDTKAVFAEKNKGVLFCSRECQQQYYK